MTGNGDAVGAKRARALAVWVFAAGVLAALASTNSRAQSSNHAEHHPGTAGSGAAPTSGTPMPSQSISPSPMGGCMGMMCGMGGPRKEFYPALMDMPSMSAEQRGRVEALARTQVSAGTDDIAVAEAALRHANAAGDVVGAEQAASTLRDAVNRVKSGTTTLRSLAEGRSAPDIAQDWFKAQMSIGSTSVDHGTAPFGISWFHLIAMTILAVFAAAMLALYGSRMRRANALINRLASAPEPLAPVSAAPVGAPSVSAETVSIASRSGPSSAEPAHSEPASTIAPARTGIWKGQLQVAAIFKETGDVKTFRLRNPLGGPIPFAFLPGQFLTYSAKIDEKLVRRSYTIASSAAQTAYVETTIKREEPGIFSDYMHDKVVEGDLIDVMAPSGVFTFTGKEADSVVLIGGGVGITPLMAAVRYLFDSAWPGEIFLIYGAQTTQHFIFRDELEYLQRRMRNLHVVATMARAEGTSWMGAQGHISKEFLTQSVPEIAKRRVHLCGPPGMMEAMKKILAELEVPPEQVKTEAFGPARGAVPPPGVTQVTPALPGGPAGTVGLNQPPTITVPAIGPATATIRFATSNKTVPLAPDKTVLEVAEAVGVSIDYSCRVGICGVCKTRLLDGNVSMEVQDALTPEDKARNIILACQAKSIGNLAVDA